MSEITLQPYFYEGQLILPAEQGLGEVWLSGIHFASKIENMRYNKIETVISAFSSNLSLPDTINHHKFSLKDNWEQQIRDLFYPIRRLLEESRKKGNVLIHCAAGISRSTALLMAYMMHKYEKGYETCLNHIKKKRACAQPNPGFKQQLQQFAGDLKLKEGKLSFK